MPPDGRADGCRQASRAWRSSGRLARPMPEPLSVDVLIVVEELANGDFVAWPFGERDKVAYAREREDAIEQQELFLREYLARISAAELARFNPHAEAYLHVVEVELDLPFLPERKVASHALPGQRRAT